MQATFALVSFLSLPLLLAVAQITTEGGCTNFACHAIEASVTICDSKKTTDQAYRDCLCTDVRVFAFGGLPCKLTPRLQVFKVNFNRCITGFVCAWNGTGNPDDVICTAEFCIGQFPKTFQPQAICCKSLFSGVGMPTDFQS